MTTSRTSGPRITVCIPTYNRRPMLERSLASVLSQDVDDLEVFVSDNASTDDTAEYIASIEDSRLHYARLPENIGLFGNLSQSLRLGSGRYRVMLPDDDLMLPGNLARKADFLDTHPSAGMVHSAFRFLDGEGRPVGEKQSWARLSGDVLEPGTEFLHRSFAIGGIVCVPSVMMRSSAIQGEQFDGDDGPYADLALWLRIARRHDVGYLDEALSGFLVHAGSASSGYDVVKVRGARGEQHRMSTRHADAVRLSHGRFLERSDLEPDLRRGLAATLRSADRRLRMAILAHQVLPDRVLDGAKRMIGWNRGKLAYRMLAVDAAIATLPKDSGMML